MKTNRIIIALLLPTFLAVGLFTCVGSYDDDTRQQHFAKPVGWVNDYTQLFSKAETDTLAAIIDSNKRATTNEIAIIVTNDSNITADGFDNYVTALHNNWGVGTKEKNNGVLICIVPRLHKIRISNGYGIEGKMNDSASAAIINNIIVPEFKQLHYYLGIKKGLYAVIDKIK